MRILKYLAIVMAFLCINNGAIYAQLKKAAEIEKVKSFTHLLDIGNALLQKNIYFCFTDYAKAFDYMDHSKLWKILKRWEYQTTLLASWENYMQLKKQPLEPDMEQWTDSKLGKQYIKAVYCNLAY